MAKGYKTGGRKLGTPNKTGGEVKPILAAHSLAYYTPDETGVSPFERDLAQLSPADRVMAEIKLLKFHTAEMKAVDATASVSTTQTIEAKLRELAEEE